MDKFTVYVDNHSGRDKVLRTLCYTSQYISAVTNNEDLSKKFEIFSKQLSLCRRISRILDDIPTLKQTFDYGLGKKEKDKLMQLCGIAINISNQLYFPCEHIAWAADLKLISISSTRWWTASTSFWALTNFLRIIKLLRYYQVLQALEKRLYEDGTSSRNAINDITNIEKTTLLTITRCTADFILAVSYLPSGTLWGSKLDKWQVGLLGTISSILGIYQSLN